MQDEISERSYRGQVFSSKEARDLYLASRGLQPKPLHPPKRLNFFLIFVGVVTVLVTFGTISNWLTPRASVPVLSPGKPSESSLQVFATLINLSGQLCARVTAVQPITGNDYLVSCIRYRDGTGIATYEVDAATGKVK